MTNKTITLTVPNDDAIALHHLGEAMQRMAAAHGFDVTPDKITIKELIELISKGEGKFDDNGTLHVTAPGTVHSVEINGAIERNEDGEIGTTLTKGMSKDEMRDALFAAQDAVKLPSLSGESLEQHIPAAELAKQQTVIDESEPTIEERPDHDSDGTPWDERIHAESRALNADGTWRARRKPKDMEQAEWEQYVEDVKAELSGELPETDQSETPDDVEPAPVAPPVVTPPSVTAPVGDKPTDFISLLQWLTGNGYNSVVIDPVLKANGLANLGEVKDKPEMVSVIVEGVLNSVRGE